MASSTFFSKNHSPMTCGEKKQNCPSPWILVARLSHAQIHQEFFKAKNCPERFCRDFPSGDVGIIYWLIDWKRLENTFPLINRFHGEMILSTGIAYQYFWRCLGKLPPGHVLLTVPWYYNGNYECCNQFQRTTTGKETKTHTHTSTQHIIELLISTNTRCLQPFLKPISKKNSSKWEFSPNVYFHDRLCCAAMWASMVSTPTCDFHCWQAALRLKSFSFRGPKFGEWIQIVVGRNLLPNNKLDESTKGVEKRVGIVTQSVSIDFAWWSWGLLWDAHIPQSWACFPYTFFFHTSFFMRVVP